MCEVDFRYPASNGEMKLSNELPKAQSLAISWKVGYSCESRATVTDAREPYKSTFNEELNES